MTVKSAKITALVSYSLCFCGYDAHYDAAFITLHFVPIASAVILIYTAVVKSNLRLLILIKSPIAIILVKSADPPYDKKGSGIPVIGMIPITIPMLTIKWKKNIPKIPAQM